jgi:hypothetical protein
MCLKIRCDGKSEKFCKILWETGPNSTSVFNSVLRFLTEQTETHGQILPSGARHGSDRAGARGGDAALVACGGGAGGRRGRREGGVPSSSAAPEEAAAAAGGEASRAAEEEEEEAFEDALTDEQLREVVP